MGILQKLLFLSKTAVHGGLEKLEQPVTKLGRYMRQKREEIDVIRQAHGLEVAAGMKLTQHIDRYHRMVEHSERKAAEAIADDRKIDAGKALEARQDYLSRAAEYIQALDDSERRIQELERKWRQAKSDYTEMQARREEMLGRSKSKAKPASQPQLYAQSSAAAYEADAELLVGSLNRSRPSKAEREEEQSEMAMLISAAAEASREVMLQEQLNRLRYPDARH